MFKNRIAPKNKPIDPKNMQVNHAMGKDLDYDNRSSCYLKAGTDYGIGFDQPVGHNGNPKKNLIPQGVKVIVYERE